MNKNTPIDIVVDDHKFRENDTEKDTKNDIKSTDSIWAKSMPWLVGGGMALAHINSSLQCTIPQQGRCSTCGSCIVAIGVLVGWALYKNKKPNQGAFGQEDTRQKSLEYFDDNPYRKP